MVSQIPPVKCPKCKKSVLGIDRGYGGRRDLTEVTVHHFDQSQANCVFKMSWKDAQDLANSITRDIGGRK
jgi:hypothetical protein